MKFYLSFFKKIFYTLLLFVIGLQQTMAKDIVIETIYNSNSTPILNESIIGQELVFQDELTFYTDSNIKNINSSTFIEFGYTGLPLDDYLTGYKARIVLNIIPILTNGSDGTVYSKTLQIEYNSNLDQSNINDLNLIKIDNSIGMKITITSLNFEANNTLFQGNPGNIYLKLKHQTDRYCGMDMNTSTTFNTVQLQSDNELLFTWNEVPCAEEYELEWTWIDNFKNSTTDVYSPDQIELSINDFKYNNTRVRLDANQLNYKIPLIFSHGYIVYRIRPIGRFLNHISKKYYGAWSFNPVNPDAVTTISDWTNSHYLINNSFEDKKNWQYQASYAENGKKKEVVSFFDGTLRNRQTVTKINTNNKIVIGEVIYDNQGRPAIEVLPVPIDNTQIKHYGPGSEYQNLVAGQSHIFTHKDFDWDSTIDTNAACGSIIKQMSTVNGAAKYYSNNNSQTNNWQDFVPDANGYPFSQIQYTPDNTGRIKRKGGVGQTHQLGNLANPSHEMKYFYGVPIDKELNRLFGYNVGYATHYKKNAVVDPNGQISVSYIDPQGRTIATSLVADNPNSLLGLDDETTLSNNFVIHQQFLDNLLITNHKISTGNFGVLKDGLEVNAQKLVLGDNNYEFKYNFNITGGFNFDCLDNNTTEARDRYPFIYDFGISVKNACGDEKLPQIDNNQLITTIGTYTTTNKDFIESVTDDDGNVTTNILYNYEDVNLVSDQESTSFNIENLTNYNNSIPLSTGNISIFKKITVNKDALNTFADDYIRKALQGIFGEDCLLSVDDLIPNATLQGCFATCQECVDSLGERQQYIDTQIAALATTNLAPEVIVLFEDRFSQEYDLLLEECNIPCQNSTFYSDINGELKICIDNLEQLINDMKPTGQYGVEYTYTDEDGNTYQISNPDMTNIYSTNNNLRNYYFATENTNNNSWKDPVFYTNGDTHYFEEDSTTISYLEIDSLFQLDENGIQILSNEAINNNNYQEVNGKIQFEPQYCNDVSYFLTNYKDSWAKSLVKYHPEYVYYDFTIKYLCDTNHSIDFYDIDENDIFLQNSTPLTVNSDAYDYFLTQILDTDNPNINQFFPDQVGSTKIMDLDPFFNSTLSYLNEVNQHNIIMEHALDSNYENTGHPLLIEAYKNTFCNSITVCNFNNITIADINNLTSTQKTRFWQNYRGLYLSLKGKIISTFRDIFAYNIRLYIDDVDVGLYNGCIGTGNEGVNNTTIGSLLSHYTNTVNVNNLLNTSVDNLCSSDNSAEISYYAKKVKRFISADGGFYDSTQSDEQIVDSVEEFLDYNYYTETGNCPLINDLQMYLDNTFVSINCQIPVDINYSGEYTGHYLTPDLYNAMEGNHSYNADGSSTIDGILSYSIAANNNTLNMGLLLDDVAATSTPVVVEIIGSTGLPSDNTQIIQWDTYGNEWTIEQIKNVHYTEYDLNTHLFHFQCIAKVKDLLSDPNSPLFTEILLTGTTNAPIGECYSTGSVTSGNPIGNPIFVPDGVNECCNTSILENAFTNNLIEIINDLLALSEQGIDISNYPLSNLVSYQTGFLHIIFQDFNFNAIWIQDNQGYHIEIPNTGIVFAIDNPRHIFDVIDELLTLNLNLNPNTYNENITGYVINNDGFGQLGAFNTGPAIVTQIPDFDCSLFPCGVMDSDGDGVNDLCDPCPNDPADSCNSDCLGASGKDIDNDGIIDECDNCIYFFNPGQEDTNDNGIGDVCDGDYYCKIGPYEERAQDIFNIIKNAFAVDNDYTDYGICATDDVNLYSSQFLNLFLEDFNLQQRAINYGSLISINSSNIYFDRNTYLDVFEYYDEFAYSIDIQFYVNTPNTNECSNAKIHFTIDTPNFDPNTSLLLSIENDSFTFSSDFFDILFDIKYKDVQGNIHTANCSMRIYNEGVGKFNLCYLERMSDSNSVVTGRYTVDDTDNTFYTSNDTNQTRLIVDSESNPACNSCIPQTVTPLTCDDAFNEFVQFINGDETLGNPPRFTYYNGAHSDTNPYYILDSEYFSDNSFFCRYNLQYIYQGYMNYITTLNIQDKENPLFLDILQFGNTALNFGFDNYIVVINEYQQYLQTDSDQDGVTVLFDDDDDDDTVGDVQDYLPVLQDIPKLTWSGFVDYFLSEHSEICPPVQMFPTEFYQVEVDANQNCIEFNENVTGAYNNESYQNYLNSIKEEFKEAYIEAAIDNLTENFSMQYNDKEYQYTLYYYDQAGNLIQTVPPEGVDRLDVGLDQVAFENLNSQINTYRTTVPTTNNLALLPNHRLTTNYKYNSLNQLIWQKTPDAGESVFAYDALGRIIASQNAKQQNQTPKAFSYTKYDGLGRILQAGETTLPNNIIIKDGKIKNTNFTINDPNFIVSDIYTYMEEINAPRKEVSVTKYDNIQSDFIPYFENYSSNSRGRVTSVFYFDNLNNYALNFDTYNNAIFYNYDIHGNVKEIVRKINDNDVLTNQQQNIKRTKYEYDLISGNVNKVIYQKGEQDQFIHKYQYDADNRITNVQTSRDGIIWEKDATYKYYDHGPLARTILGEQQVQGLDYAYTLQGWLKAVNSDRLSPDIDMGKDGFAQSIIAKDAFAFALHYYQNDYKDRATGNNPFIMATNQLSTFNLYNGNIKSMVTSLLDKKANPINTSLNNYRYDQLNRIKSMNSWEIKPNGASILGISSTYAYDRNGNLLNLHRTARRSQTEAPSDMDSFNYIYELDPQGNIKNNKLLYIKDDVPDYMFREDIDNLPENNYQYDKIGQLTKDLAQDIQNIDWTVSGKVKRIIKTDKVIEFTYDPLGNRLSKSVGVENTNTTTKTYYIRDAQGNVLTIYQIKTTPNQNASSTPIILKEQNIYGSSRVGLQQLNEEIRSGRATSITALRLNNNYEAQITDSIPFNFRTKESINIGTKIKITKPDTNGIYNIVNIQNQDLDSIHTLHEIKLALNYQNDTYKPQLILKTYKDSIHIKKTTFTLDKILKDTDLDINFDVQILDPQNNKYDVVLTLNGKENYIIGKGITQTNQDLPYNTSHTQAISKLSNNSDNPLSYTIQNFKYAINGVKRTYTFDRGFGSPVSNDRKTTLRAPIFSWDIQGVQSRTHNRITGDKRYELSNHLGNVLSVITDRKAISNDTGILTHQNPFEENVDILPWQAQSLTTSVQLEKGRLRVESKHNLNGVEAIYTLEANKTYQFNFQIDIDQTRTNIEFGISYNNKKQLTEFIKETGKQQFTFTPETTGNYMINIAIRDAKKEYEEDQIFFLDNFRISDISERNLDLTANSITFVPNVLSYNDYYPFGMLVPNRNYSSPNYRYSFNGMEKDDEIKGSNNSLDFGARIYDPRAVRFGSIDPAYKKFPWYSPYLFAGNTPIMAGDANGLYPIVRGGKIVGYVIEPGQGPTQIAKDINNPDTQAIYGYCLQKPVTWDKVVTDNITYYAKAGNWEENTNIMSKDNLIYRDLNSNAGDELQLRFDEEPDVNAVQAISKKLSTSEVYKASEKKLKTNDFKDNRTKGGGFYSWGAGQGLEFDQYATTETQVIDINQYAWATLILELHIAYYKDKEKDGKVVKKKTEPMIETEIWDLKSKIRRKKRRLGYIHTRDKKDTSVSVKTFFDVHRKNNAKHSKEMDRFTDSVIYKK